jgi:hypothetical protein
MVSRTGGFFAAGAAELCEGAELSGGAPRGGRDMLAVKGDPDGATMWSATAGGSGTDVAWAAALRDGTFIAPWGGTPRVMASCRTEDGKPLPMTAAIRGS